MGYSTSMPAPDAYYRSLRVAPLGVWALFSIPLILALVLNRQNAPHGAWVFICAFAMLGMAFAVTAGFGTARPLRESIALGVQSSAILIMSFVNPAHIIGLLFVLVSWQLALLLEWPALVTWVALQTALLLSIYAHAYTFSQALPPIGINVGFQSFAVVAALFAKSQLRAKQQLARVNAELQATREVIIESSLVNERTRISRDLHDVMGHNLTALSIHLEVASHLADGPVKEHLQKARLLSKKLLKDVRDIVSATRAGDTIDLRRAVQALCEGVPHLQLHTELQGELVIEDPNKAEVFLRCVQEVVTNALRHSEANNLWIQVTVRDRGFLIHARDDGKGNAKPKLGLGLSNMRERLEEVGGWLTIESEPMQGFAVSAWLPSTAR